tara:strand:- start:103 stop:936 length:834 start_codon:yes stop_codon:yes gene_type:complete
VNLTEVIKTVSSKLRSTILTEGQMPKIGIICGTGLGPIAEQISDSKYLKYSDIPNFPTSSVKGHEGIVVAGQIHSKSVIAFKGRFHFYEGYSMQEVTLPVRVMRDLGITHLIVTNAAGGLNRNFRVGELMAIDDHINFMFQNPLIGRNEDSLGVRFPDMSAPYNQKCISITEKISLDEGIKLHRGTYLGVTGPSYETKSELRFFSKFADAVGMSTVPEVIAAKHGGIQNVLGISVITNMATGEDSHEESHDSVVKAANEATPRVVNLVKKYIAALEV